MPKPLRPQSQLEPVRLEVNPLDQQLDDAGLLGGEQFLPKWVQPLQPLANHRLRQPDTFRRLGAPRGHDDLRRPERVLSWSMTAASMLAADTRRIAVSTISPFNAAWQT